MDRKQQVLLKLKPKVKAFGFNKKELMSVAAKIADNLTSEEEASEEDVNAEIDTQINAVLPYLQVSQSHANRVIEESRRKNDDGETDDDDEDSDDDTSTTTRQTGSGKNPKNKGKENDAPDWAKGMMQTIQNLSNEIVTLKGDKVTSSRKSKLESILKDTGTFGTRSLKSFSKMKFENEEEFDEFISDVEEDLKAYNQERADAGLSSMGIPPVSGTGKQAKKEEVLTDSEIDAIVGNL